jgi:diguanylate cyclase (GGDEF)-like protein
VLAQFPAPAFPAASGDPVIVDLPAAGSPGGAERAAGMPLVRAGRVRAWLCAVDGRRPDTVSDAGRKRLRGMAGQGIPALEAALLHAQVRALAATDALTGLANRRSFFEHLHQELARSRRTGAPLSIALLDLNGFKAINDTQGHRTGDETLVRVARSLTRNTRRYDLVARFGGDEFVLLLPDAGNGEAQDIVGRLPTGWSWDDPSGESLGVTLCWGIATWPEDGDAPEPLLQKADRRLYAMKSRLYRGAAGRRA